MVPESQYVNLNTTGYVKNLRIELVGNEKTNYPVRLTSVVLNAHRPFSFNFLRFFGVIGILAFTYLFRPGSSVYRVSIARRPKLSKGGIICAVSIEVVLISSFLFMGSNLVGVKARLPTTLIVGRLTALRTRLRSAVRMRSSMPSSPNPCRRKLYLKRNRPTGFSRWTIPMIRALVMSYRRRRASRPVRRRLLPGALLRVLCVVPVLLFYLPFYLATGASFPTAIGVLLAVIAFILGCSALLDRFARYHFKQVSLWAVSAPPDCPCHVLRHFVSGEVSDVLLAADCVRPGVLCLGLYLWMCGRGLAEAVGWYLAARYAWRLSRGADLSSCCCRFLPSRCSGAATSPSAGFSRGAALGNSLA